MREHFSQEENNDDIAKRVEVQKAQAEFLRNRLMEEREEPGNLSPEKRQALRDMLVEAGVKVNMYEQFQDSVSSKKKVEETKDAIMRNFDEGQDSLAA